MALDRNSIEYLMRRAEDGGSMLSAPDIVRLHDYGVCLQAEVREARFQLQDMEDKISDCKIFQVIPEVIVREARRLERAKRTALGEKSKCELALTLLQSTT